MLTYINRKRFMSKFSRIFSFNFISAICIALISFSVMAASAQSALFAEKNFQALQKDPTELFSKENTCYLKAILGKKDFDAFKETMAQMTNVDDEADYVSISGNVKGLFTVMEGFFRMSKSGNVWIAYLTDGKVHYFTNDAASVKQSPKVMQDWASRFKEAKWVDKEIKVDTKSCK